MTSSSDISEPDLVICSQQEVLSAEWLVATLDLDVAQYLIFDNEDI